MYNISGPARHPPSSILKKLQSLDAELRLGHKLCISRNPGEFSTTFHTKPLHRLSIGHYE